MSPFGHNCSLKVDFVGKVESIGEDWKNLLKSHACTADLPFDLKLGRHDNQMRDKDVISQVISNHSLVAVENDLAVSQAMREGLQLRGGSYRRALCWLFLVDYVMFNYDLPKDCDRPEMQLVIAKTRSS